LKAVVFDQSISCRDVPEPRSDGGVVLSVRRAGICGTDLAIASGDYKVKAPLVLGHEIFGTAWKAPGEGSGLLGKRCVTEINVGCGRCDSCRAGVKSHCVRGEALGIHRNGGFAEYVSTPLDNVHVVPDSISDEEAVFVEPLAACVQLTKMAMIDAGSTIAIVGSGRMGLLIVQVLRQLRPGRLVAIGHPGAKLDMGRRLGAEVFNASEIDLPPGLAGVKFDNVVEATGSTSGLELAFKLVKPRGTLHLKSTHGLPATLDITRVVVDEIRIQGSRCGPFDEAIGLLDSGTVKVRDLVTHRFPLERCEEAFRVASSKDAIKAIFEL